MYYCLSYYPNLAYFITIDLGPLAGGALFNNLFVFSLRDQGCEYAAEVGRWWWQSWIPDFHLKNREGDWNYHLVTDE